MRFRFIEEHGRENLINRLFQVLDVGERGLRVYRGRPACQRQWTDMIVLSRTERHIPSVLRYADR